MKNSVKPADLDLHCFQIMLKVFEKNNINSVLISTNMVDFLFQKDLKKRFSDY